MTPIMLICAEHDHDKGQSCKDQCKGDITCHVRGTWDQTKNVIDKNKKENGKEIGKKFWVVVTKIGDSYFIPYKGDHRFKQTLRALRCGSHSIAAFVFGGNLQHDPGKNE